MDLSQTASGTPNQLPPAAPPEAPPAEPSEPSDSELREQARKVLFQEGSEEETDPEKTPTEPAPGEEKKQEEKKDGAEAFSVDGVRSKILEVLKELTPEQRDQVLGTSDEAFAALTEKRRELRLRDQQTQAQRAELQSHVQEYSRLKKEFDERLIEGKSDPEKALALFGWDLESANNYFLNGKQVPPERKYADLEERVNKTIEERLTPREEALKQAEERIKSREAELNMQAWHSGVRSELSTLEKAEFPLATKWPQDEIFDAVIALQRIHFSSTKKPLATRNALMHIEDRLRIQRKYLLEDGDVARDDRKKPEAEKGQSLKTPNAKEASERVADDDDEPDPVKMKRALRALRGE